MTSDTTARIQVYLASPRLAASLSREAKAAGISVSQAAARAIARGLTQSLSADPEDRLLKMERSLRDHMRATARDMIILQEVLVEIARALFLRMPDSWCDEDPTVQAAVDRRLDLMLDAAAVRIARARSASQVEADSRKAAGDAKDPGLEAYVEEGARETSTEEDGDSDGAATQGGAADSEASRPLQETTTAGRPALDPHDHPLLKRTP